MRTATYFSWMESFSKNKLWSRNGPAMSFQVSHFRVVALFSCLFHFFFPCAFDARQNTNTICHCSWSFIWSRMNAAPKTDGLVSHSSGASHSPGSRLQHFRWTPQPLDALALDAPSKKSDTQWLWDSRDFQCTSCHGGSDKHRRAGFTRTSKDVYPRGRPIITYLLSPTYYHLFTSRESAPLAPHWSIFPSSAIQRKTPATRP